MKLRLLFLLLCAALSPAYAADPVDLLKDGGFENGITAWFMKNPDRCQTEKTVISNATLTLPFRQALRVDVSPQPQDKPWSVVLRQTVNAPLTKGRQLVFRVWLRSPESATVTGFIEAAKPPYAKALSGEWKLSPDWKEYEIAGPCPQEFAAGEANCGFFLSHAKASIRLADARLFCLEKGSVLPPLAVGKPEEVKPAGGHQTGGKVVTPVRPVVPGAEGELLQNGDFKQGMDNWLPIGMGMTPAITIAKAGPYERVLEMRVAPITNTAVVPPPFVQMLRQKIEVPLLEGDGLTLKAWLRSKDNNDVTLRIDSPTGAPVLNQLVHLTPEWKEYEVKGRCQKECPAGSAQCVMWLGHKAGNIQIAGVRITRTPDVPENWGVPEKVFNRENLLDNGDFTDNAPRIGVGGPVTALGKWIVAKNDNCRPEIVAVEAGPFKSALRLNLTKGERPAMPANAQQTIPTPPLTANDSLVLRFWAHGTDGVRMRCGASRYYLERMKEGTSLTSKTASSVSQTITLSPEWKEYEIRLGAKPFPPGAPETTTQANTGFYVEPFEGEVEVTGFRLAIEAAAP